MMRSMKFGVLAMVLLLAACQTARGRHEGTWPPEQSQPSSRPLPGTSPNGVPAPVGTGTPQAVPLPPPAALPNYPKAADEISSGAVLSLMRKANEQRASGNLDQAASTLERAQRIEPRNYFVWSALADTYLQQKNYEQAISVARKSNSLGRGNVYVEQQNWRVIHDASAANGDADGAALAQARMDAIQQLLQSAAPP